MTRSEKVVRLFRKSDEEVLQQSDVLMDSFLANKSQFVERFSDLADPFALEWATATTTARELPSDYETVNEQAKATQNMKTLMQQGRNLFQAVMFYTQLAFPDDRAVLQLFGQPQYHGVRNNHLKLPVLLRSAFTQVSKPEYKTALLAKGMKEAEIALLDSLAEAIIAQGNVQQNAKKARLLATNQRIAAMNVVWKKMALVCQCAKLVFQDDAAKYNLFLLSDGKSQAKEKMVND
jgi:hypothetical protein